MTPSDVKVVHLLCMPADEVSPGIHILSHKFLEYLVCVDGILDLHLLEDPVGRVHRGGPELPGIHLTETLVALDRDAFFAELTDDLPHIFLAVGVLLLFSPGDPVERRLGDVDVAVLDECRHIPVEEREEERPDMRTVDIRIGHQDDMVVPGPLDVETVADPGADSGYQRLDLGVLQDLVLRSLLDVQDLAPQGEDCLELSVSPLLCGTACRISFHDVEFALCRVPLLAVGEFAGQTCGFQRALSPGEFASVLCSFTGTGGRKCLVHDDLEGLRVLLEVLGERRVDEGIHDAADVAVAEAHLGLPLELRVRDPGADDRGEPFPDVLALDLSVVVLEEVVSVGGTVDRPGEGAPEPLKVGPPFPGVHAVDVGVDRLRV